MFNLQNRKGLRASMKNLMIFLRYQCYLFMNSYAFKYLSEAENHPDYCNQGNYQNYFIPIMIS